MCVFILRSQLKQIIYLFCSNYYFVPYFNLNILIIIVILFSTPGRHLCFLVPPCLIKHLLLGKKNVMQGSLSWIGLINL